MLREPTYASTNYATGYYTTGDGWVIVQESPLLRFGGGMAISQLGQLVVSGSTTGDGLHQHSITVGPFSGNTGPVSTANSGASSAAVTGSVGSGTPHTNIPASKKARFVFRAL